MALRVEIDGMITSLDDQQKATDRQYKTVVLLSSRPAAAVFGQALVWLIPGVLLLAVCLALPSRPAARRTRPGGIDSDSEQP
ncbi:hypothetical protein D3C76_1573950 [compost metagenome]